MKKSDRIQVKIYDIAFGGRAVGKLVDAAVSDKVIFVDGYTLPGEVVDAYMTKIKPNYIEARQEKIVTQSEKRILPRCKHFGICGGCFLQHMNYGTQLTIKQKMVTDALTRLGGFVDIAIASIIGCENPWFYRNKMEFTFGHEGLGLHPAKNFREVFQVEECFLQSNRCVEILQATEAWAKEKNIKPYDVRTHEGVLRNLIVREAKNTQEILVNLVATQVELPEKESFIELISKKFPQVTSLYHTAVIVRRGHRTVTQEFLLAGSPALHETLTVKTKIDVKELTLAFDISPQAFFQPNTKQAEILYGTVLDFAQAKNYETVLDLFCGTGTIGMFFAKTGCRVTGIELNASAVDSARKNAMHNKIENIEFVCADVGALKLLPSTFKLLITDPPRAGIAPKTLEKIVALQIPRWIYVSCNPTTLARDLKVACTQGGYKLKKVQPVDMFPQTYHVETVCLLEKN